MDRVRGIIPRADYLELVFSDVLYDYTIHDVSFGIYAVSYTHLDVYKRKVVIL